MKIYLVSLILHSCSSPLKASSRFIRVFLNSGRVLFVNFKSRQIWDRVYFN